MAAATTISCRDDLIPYDAQVPKHKIFNEDYLLQFMIFDSKNKGCYFPGEICKSNII